MHRIVCTRGDIMYSQRYRIWIFKYYSLLMAIFSFTRNISECASACRRAPFEWLNPFLRAMISFVCRNGKRGCLLSCIPLHTRYDRKFHSSPSSMLRALGLSVCMNYTFIWICSFDRFYYLLQLLTYHKKRSYLNDWMRCYSCRL